MPHGLRPMGRRSIRLTNVAAQIDQRASAMAATVVYCAELRDAVESKICIIGETTEVLSTLQRVLSLGYDGTRALQ